MADPMQSEERLKHERRRPWAEGIDKGPICDEGRREFWAPCKKVLSLVSKVASHRLPPVLITGETGTGKELVARAVHQRVAALPARRLFVSVNCAAIPHGLIASELFWP